MEYAAEERIPCCTGFSPRQLDEAMAAGQILQSTALVYDTDQSLRFSLGGVPAIMPHGETADGITTSEVREIAVLTRVGRATCFVILRREGAKYILSRAKAQQRWNISTGLPRGILSAVLQPTSNRSASSVTWAAASAPFCRLTACRSPVSPLPPIGSGSVRS